MIRQDRHHLIISPSGTQRLFPLIVIIALSMLFSVTESANAADWRTRINFDEEGVNGFPNSSTNLLDADGTRTLTYDLYTGSGARGIEPIPGADGVTDLTVIITLVESINNQWSRTEADYSTASQGSFRSDWRINPNDCSAENTFAYVKFDFIFSGALSNIQAGQFRTYHTSTNGESEAYEYTLVALNGISEAEIQSGLQTYKNSQYIAGQSISEHIFGVADPDAKGGPVLNHDGVWAVDDLNTVVTPPPAIEESTSNPQSGDGATKDDQEVSGTDFGLAMGDKVTQVTYYFGLQDVAFDTDGDGCTQTNTTPSAGVSWFDVGYEKTTAIELAAFDVEKKDDAAILTWATASEVDNAGFNLYRAPSALGPWQRINLALIPAKGSPWSTATYTFVDKKASEEQLHGEDNQSSDYYRLEDVDYRGVSTQHVAVTATVSEEQLNAGTSKVFMPLLLPSTIKRNSLGR